MGSKVASLVVRAASAATKKTEWSMASCKGFYFGEKGEEGAIRQGISEARARDQSREGQKSRRATAGARSRWDGKKMVLEGTDRRFVVEALDGGGASIIYSVLL